MNNLLDSGSVRQLLNLQGSPLLGKSIADRQIEVIRKGFNYLSQESHNALYIADEVGLGKTYIALGIASLLRHFSKETSTYQDVIIVPKENLQYKWEKEIRQFIKYNYLLLDNRVKSVIGVPVGELSLKESLTPLLNDHPAYHLYRGTQFSMGLILTNESKKEQLEKLSSRLNTMDAVDILEKSYQKGYFLANNKTCLKKLYAYLLSMCNPTIELLIVDEGHNYKQGLGTNDDAILSDRNNVLARFFGLKRMSDDDRRIFDDFPELQASIKPKVQKLIVLSATPKTYSLLEIKHQFDLFLKKHILSNTNKEQEVEDKLTQFLIRGNMEYKVGSNSYSRNLCRYEYRSGGVEKEDPAKGLLIEDNQQAIVLGLMQYNTIKHLGSKHNASFELGMLAGFETFRIDQEKRKEVEEKEQEYEEVRLRKTKTSQDYGVIKTIIESYRESFQGDMPPHPKQDALVNATFKMMLTGEKSLIFVRRVASAYELEKRLLEKWEGVVNEELQTKWKKRLPSDELTQLLDCYTERRTNRKLAECVDVIFSEVIEKWLTNKNQFSFEFFSPRETGFEDPAKVLNVALHYLYNHYRYIERGNAFYELLCKQCSLVRIKSELLSLAYDLLLTEFNSWKQHLENVGEEEESDDSYFFHSYFKEAHAKGFKKRLNSTDWFDVNFYLLNQYFQISSFSQDNLVSNCAHVDNPTLKELQEGFIKSLLEETYTEHLNEQELYPNLLSKKTLITEIITKLCKQEFLSFLKELTARRKADIFYEIKVLTTIIKSCLRNGAGFLPLYVADKAGGDFIENYIALISEEGGVFELVLKEVRTIIKDFSLIRAINFPEGESFRQIESKLYYQTPILGLTGQSKKSKSNVAAQFRMPGFPYILVTTDIFREGEDLHSYCNNIFHYGIAWNCSDMEQRTGRIDRINSLSHRKLLESDLMTTENQIHVFYPYIQNTLEVNQVSHLFRSINSFVETFNDFAKPVLEEAVAYTNESIELMAPVLQKPLHSKYDHENFKGYEEVGSIIQIQGGIGLSKEQLLHFLLDMEVLLTDYFSYHFGPTLDTEQFLIKADMILEGRMKRRGPFRMIVRNDITPGKFILEVAAYLFKISSKVQRLIKESELIRNGEFELGSIEDFYALKFVSSIESFETESFLKKLHKLLEISDSLEEQLVKTDNVIFN